MVDPPEPSAWTEYELGTAADAGISVALPAIVPLNGVVTSASTRAPCAEKSRPRARSALFIPAGSHVLLLRVILPDRDCMFICVFMVVFGLLMMGWDWIELRLVSSDVVKNESADFARQECLCNRIDTFRNSFAGCQEIALAPAAPWTPGAGIGVGD
jgi:hypothetical protein